MHKSGCPTLMNPISHLRRLLVFHHGATAQCLRKPLVPSSACRLSDNASVHHKLWDNVVWSEAQMCEARKKVEANSSEYVNRDLRAKLETEADSQWDGFYSQHQNRFFKDRHWLFTEFPELATTSLASGSTQQARAPPTEREGSPDTSPARDQSPTEPSSVDSQTSSKSTGLAHHPQVGSRLIGDDVEEVKSSLGTDTILSHEQEVASGTAEACEAGGSAVEGRHGSLTNPRPEADGETFPGWSSRTRILEVGCGVGNTIFPILQTNTDPSLFVYGCDFSSVAIDIVKQHREYDRQRCHAFVHDITDEGAALPFPEGSLDIIILIFVLSAIPPEKVRKSLSRLASYLKPGGLILLRDYGRYDMAQLRFKKGRCLSDHFYARGDGTLVYFFTQDELRTLFTGAGLLEEQNVVDHRLQVNRGRQLTMYRVWMQCKYRKPTQLDGQTDRGSAGLE